MLRWRFRELNPKSTFRRFSTSFKQLQHLSKDEGSWDYSWEWWDSDVVDHRARSVFRANSVHGNGVVSVLSYPSSLPSTVHWSKTEDWLRNRCTEVCSDSQYAEDLKILGYQWRVLRFNDSTRQSTVKVLATASMSAPATVYYMQQPHCLAVPYVKSMVAAGMTALSTCNYDLPNAVSGKKKLRVLCVGHGGGSLPLFLASKIQGAVIDIVEIDPLVISASINAMGFPSFSIAALPGQHTLSNPTTMDDLLWRGVHERLFLHKSDAENFILNSSYLYDIIFMDAYDGDDIFPCTLWDPQSPFLESLSKRLDPFHGTVVVNLHSDDVGSSDPILPMGKHVSRVSRAYKDVIVGNESEKFPGFGFTVPVPWVCNTTLVVCRGFGDASGRSSRDLVLNSLFSKSVEVEREMNMPFSCSEYLKEGFVLLD